MNPVLLEILKNAVATVPEEMGRRSNGRRTHRTSRSEWMLRARSLTRRAECSRKRSILTSNEHLHTRTRRYRGD